MKLRNLLLVAALFFSAGAAFAEEPVTQDDVLQTTYDFGTTTKGYYYSTNGNNALTVTLLQYAGTAVDESGWTYFVVGYKADGTTQTFYEPLTLSNENITGRELTADEIAALTTYRSPGDDKLYAYEFTVPFDESVTEKIGFAGRNGSDGKLVYSIVNVAKENDFHFSDKTTKSILFFGKNDFENGKLKAQIMSDGIVVGSPLPAPVVTLLIALGFGAMLVMYRNRKQAKA